MLLEEMLDVMGFNLPEKPVDINVMVAETRYVGNLRGEIPADMYNHKLFQYKSKYNLTMEEAIHNVKSLIQK